MRVKRLHEHTMCVCARAYMRVCTRVHACGRTMQRQKRKRGLLVGEGFIGGLALLYIVSNGFA